MRYTGEERSSNNFSGHSKSPYSKQKKSASIESNKTNVTSATNATDGDKKLLKRKTNFEFTGSLIRLSPKEEKKRDISDSKDE